MTLIELMVALAIGSLLIVGALAVYVESQQTFRTAESVARLQETARLAMDRLEPDVRMASYFGLTARPSKVLGRAAPSDPPAFTVANDCTVNFAVNLDTPVGGDNDLVTFPDTGCDNIYSAAAQPGSDTLVIRRAAELPVDAPRPGTLYIQSAHFQASRLFIGPTLPSGYSPATSQTHALVVSAYYVSRQSSLSTPGRPIPSLRIKTLTSFAGRPTIVDQEVMPGVEDLQVQYGVDTDAPGTANRGSIDRYVNAGDPLLDAASGLEVAVLAVRVWLRVRAERREYGFEDTANYVYADRNIAAPKDEFRRLLVSKTIYLRNTRPPI